MFFEQGMRGGVSYINKRYSKANNKYLPEYDKTTPEKFIIYLDMDNLYGYAMSHMIILSYDNIYHMIILNRLKIKLNKSLRV